MTRRRRGKGSRKGDDLLDSLRPEGEQTQATGPGAQDPKKTTPPLPPPAAEEVRDTGQEGEQTQATGPGAQDKGEIIQFPGAKKQETEGPETEAQDPGPGTSKPDISPSPSEPLEEELAGLAPPTEVIDEDLPSFDAPDDLPQPQGPVPETEDPKPRTEDPGPEPDTGHGAPEPDIAPTTQDPEPKTEDPGPEPDTGDTEEGLPGLVPSEPGPQPSPQPIPFSRAAPKDPERGTPDSKPETQDPGHRTPGPVSSPGEDRELDAWLDGAPDVTYRGGTKGKPALVLVQMFNDKKVREITLQQDIVKIGKLDSSHLRISGDEDVSRMHAVMEYAGGTWVIIDLGSAIGTILNGQKVNKAQINEGDEIKIGSAVLKVREIKEMKPDKQDPKPVALDTGHGTPRPAPASAPRVVPQPAPAPRAAPQETGRGTPRPSESAQDPGHGAPDTERPPGPPKSKVSGEIDTSKAQAQGSQQAQEQRNAQAGETMMVNRGISWSDAIIKNWQVKLTSLIGGAGATFITSAFGAGNWAWAPFIGGIALAAWFTINDRYKR